MTQFFLVTGRRAEQKRKCDSAFCVFYDTKDKNRTDAFFFFHAPKAQRMGNNYFISYTFGYFKRKGVRHGGHPLLYILTTLIYCLVLKALLTSHLKLIAYKTNSKLLSKIANFLLKNLMHLSVMADILSIPSLKVECVFKLNNKNNMLNINVVSIICNFINQSSLSHSAKLMQLTFLLDKPEFCVFKTTRQELKDKFGLQKSSLNDKFLELEQQRYIKRHHYTDDKKAPLEIELLPLTFEKVVIQSQILQIDTSNTDAQIIVSNLSVFNKLLKEYQSIEISREQLKHLNSVNKLAKNDTLYFEADLSIENDLVSFKNYCNFITTLYHTQSFLHRPESFCVTQKAIAI